MQPITGMISYSWVDADAAELIHEELALRGVSVFHDRCSFPGGERIAANMAEAVATCDAFVAYLTPNSLYLGAPPDAPRPAIHGELLPALQRWRKSGSPMIVPLTHGLGVSRSEASEHVRKATGEDIASLWTPITLDQSTPSISQPEAAAVGRYVTRQVLETRLEPRSELDLALFTRGEPGPPASLTIDATGILGGSDHRPGTVSDWGRLLYGMVDLRDGIARATKTRKMHVTARAHLTACVALGRVLHQAAGWDLAVEGRLGDTALPTEFETDPLIHVNLDRGSDGTRLTVEIDLLGLNVSDLVTAHLRTWENPPAGRLQIHRTASSVMSPNAVGNAAARAAHDLRSAVASLRPHEVHIFMATPAEFAVLIGHRLTALFADLHLYERTQEGYTPSLVIPATLA